jgi:hypothetical protein
MHDDDERFLRTIGAEARRIPPASSDLDHRSMAAVRVAHRSERQGWLARLAAPRTVRVSPIAAIAYAAGLVAVVLRGERALHGHTGGPAVRESPYAAAPAAGAPAVEAFRTVRFVFMAPQAASVAVVGDFNHWSATATPLRTVGSNGVWTVDVPLSAGRHEYAFVVDGAQWVADPAAPQAPVADFGAPNSVITVMPELS